MAAPRRIRTSILPEWMGEVVAPDDPGRPARGGSAYKILPRPSVVLGFQYRGRLRVVRDAGEELLDRAGVTGLQSEFRVFRPEPGTNTIIVNLKPYAAFRLLRCPMDEIADAHVPLDAIMKGSTVRELELRIADAPSLDEAARTIESFILRMAECSAAAINPVVAGAVERLIADHGSLPIEELAIEAGVSRRQLERLFLLQVGTSPKQFASIARFDWAVKRLSNYPRSIDLAYEAGYADQAHFIRAFRRQAGISPGQYRRGGENA